LKEKLKRLPQNSAKHIVAKIAHDGLTKPGRHRYGAILRHRLENGDSDQQQQQSGAAQVRKIK
jgi:hypothetical protein